MNPEYIIVHHSLTEDNFTVSWNAIRQYHVNINKWKDIGYHAGIENINGHYEIMTGRMEDEAGAHCIGFNDNSLGICVVGNFDQEGPNTEQIALLKKWCVSKMNIYGIKSDRVLGHWETYTLRGVNIEKSCPGNHFHMREFRATLP